MKTSILPFKSRRLLSLRTEEICISLRIERGTAGGMDIWVSHRLDYTWKRWSTPQRLLEPVNSEFDDGQACIDDTGSFIYFASRRDGSSDIYRMPLQPKPKLSKPITIKGRIVDGDTGKAIRAELYYGP